MDKVLTRLSEERDRLHTQIDEVLDGAGQEDRDPSEAEKDLLARHKARLDQLEPQIVQLVELEERRRDARSAVAHVRRRETPPEGDDGDEDGGDEDGGDEGGPASYRHFGQYARDVLITRHDGIAANAGHGSRQRAAERLTRAVPKVLTADVAGIVPTQYISQIYQVINKARPIVDGASKVALSSGKLQWPQITNKPDVGKQSTEKTEAGDGTMVVGFLDKLADTYLVAANFSWQVVQWSNPDAMNLWFDLAAASYARETDKAAGTVLSGADATPIVVATDDLAGWMGALAEASMDIYNTTGRYADTIAANPADAYKLLGYVSTANPVFLATGSADLSTGSFPSLGGLRMVVSHGITPGGVIVYDSKALLCAENPGAPVDLRVVEPSIGGIEVGIIGAFAAAMVEPGAVAELTPPA